MSKKSVYYTIGSYLAEHLINNHIPSLSCNEYTNKVIQVTWGEAKELERLQEAWLSKRSSEEKKLIEGSLGLSIAEKYNKEREAQAAADKEWNEFLKYGYILKEKYLPHSIRCKVHDIDFSDEKNNSEIKKGIIDFLWNWDNCEWSLIEDDIIFENEIDFYRSDDNFIVNSSFVTLKLDLEAPNSYTGGDWIKIKN